MAGNPYDLSQGVPWQPASWYDDPAALGAPTIPPPMPTAGPEQPPWDWRPSEWDLPDPTAQVPPGPQPGQFQAPPPPPPEPEPPAEDQLFPWEAPAALRQGADGPRQDPAEPEEPPTYEFTPEEAEQADVDRMSKDPVAAAQEAVRLEERQRVFKAQQAADAAVQDRQAADRNMLEWQKREAQIAADRQDLVTRAQDFAKNGAKGFGDSLNFSQHLGYTLQAIAGGMVAAYHGGRNPGLEAIQKGIDQYMERQEGVLNMQADDLKARGVSSMELFKQLESQRIGAYQMAIDQIDSQAALLDPQGVRAQRLAQARIGVEAAMRKEAAESEQKLFDRHKDEHGMQMQERQLAEQKRARGAAQAQARRALEAEMLVKGFVPDAKAPGGFSPDPNRAQAMDPQTYVQVQRGQRLQQENLAHDRAIQVQDKNGRVLGLARYGPTDARKLGEVVGEYEATRQQAVRLHDLIGQYKSTYKGVGSARWPPEARRRVETIIEDMAVRVAKIRDPESVAREGEVELARKALPDLDSWTTSKKPMAAYEELVKTIDQDFDARMGARVMDWKKNKTSPMDRYKAIDRIIGGDVREAPREELIGEATIPLAGVTKQDNVLRAASISARGRLIDALGDRGGISDQEAAAIRESLAREAKSGDLSPAEFEDLNGRLAANQLVRGAPASFEERERMAIRAAAHLPPQMAAEYVADQLRLAGGKRNAYIRDMLGSGRSSSGGVELEPPGGATPTPPPDAEPSAFPDALYEEGD